MEGKAASKDKKFCQRESQTYGSSSVGVGVGSGVSIGINVFEQPREYGCMTRRIQIMNDEFQVNECIAAYDAYGRQVRPDQPPYLHVECEKASYGIKKLRKDPSYRAKERERNNEALRKLRQDPEYRARERERDRLARQKLRQDPEYRARERERNKLARQKARQDPDYRARERERNKLARREARGYLMSSAVAAAQKQKKDNISSLICPPNMACYGM